MDRLIILEISFNYFAARKIRYDSWRRNIKDLVCFFLLDTLDVLISTIYDGFDM